MGSLIGALSAPLAAHAQPTPTPSAAAGSAPTGQSLGPRPVRAVILVDESGSLTPADVEQEKAAAQVLAFGVLGNDNEVTVVGFGSSNGPGQTAVDVVCPLTGVDPSKQDSFIDCIGRLHRHGESEGNDTDHVAALTQALSILRVPGGENRTKLVFLLTDGRLDVHRSPQYGGQADARNTNAQFQLNDEIARARTDDVQIWPLGFGSADKPALDAFAAGGARQTCNDLPDNQPRARIATSADVVAQTLLDAIATANCAKTTGFDSDRLPGGSQVELKVDIPEITTDGVIVVLKGDRRVRVTYIDPNGKKITGTSTFTGDGSTFTASTTSGTVETLRIQNPRPGKWKVRLEAGTDVPTQSVAAAAMWQGVLQAIVSLDPPSPQAGQKEVVRVRLQTRKGAIDDLSVLDGVTFGARMSGGGGASQDIDLADDGRNGDTRARDGEYTGNVTIPAGARGVLMFLGTVDGPGVVGARTPFNTTVATGPPPIVASITMGHDKISPGGRIEGKVTVDNADGTPRRLRLELRDLSPGTIAELSDPNIVDSPRAGRVEQGFTIAFDPRTGEGNARGTVRLVDAANPATAYREAFFSVDVMIPDPLWVRLWWLWLLVGIAAVVAAVILARLRHASVTARGVGDVTVRLSRGGVQLGHLKAPDNTGTRFRFTIHDAQGSVPRLDNAYGDAARPYVVTRNGHGLVQVRTPDGTDHDLSPRVPVQVEHGLALTYSDPATPSGTGGSDPGWSGSRRGHDPYENAADPYAARSSSDAPPADPYTVRPFGGSARPDRNPSNAGPTRPGQHFADADATTLTPGVDPRHRDDGADDETHRFGGRPSLAKGGPGTAGPGTSRSSPRPPRSNPRNDDLQD